MRIKVIERNRSVAEEAADALERTIVLNGDGLDSTLLTEAGIGRADAVLAITDDDKTNMLAAVRAKSMGCKMAIALINDPTMVSMMGTLGIDAHINPVPQRSVPFCAISAMVVCAMCIRLGMPRQK